MIFYNCIIDDKYHINMSCERTKILQTLNNTYVQIIGHIGAFGHNEHGLKWICIRDIRVSPWKPFEERKFGREWFNVDHAWVTYHHNPALPRLKKDDHVLLNAWVTDYTRNDGTSSYGFNSVKYLRILGSSGSKE